MKIYKELIVYFFNRLNKYLYLIKKYYPFLSMDSKKNSDLNDKIPKQRRVRTKETEGKFDDDGFFNTPNGSFWDMDGEYFNRHGFDIHGGKYINKLDYIPGPTWIEELGCYPEDEEKYRKGDIDDDIDEFNDKDMELLEGDMKELDINENVELGINDAKLNELLNNIDNNNNKINIIKDKDKKDKKSKNKKKNKKKKEESLDEDEWEEIED